MDAMPPDFLKVEAAIHAQRCSGGEHDSPADAAIYTILSGPCRDLERDHPEFAAAFQALAERLGYR